MKNLQATFAVLICSWAISASVLPVVAEETARKEGFLQSGNVVFAVIGDYGLAGQPEADVANLVKSWNPDFIVTTGDNNYPIGAADSIDRNIGQYYHEFIYPYNGSYGAGAAYKRFFPALGNHDWMSGDANPYFEYFSFYSKNSYYEFVNGPVHFFILDSDPKEPDGVSSTSKQAKWLKNGLAVSTSIFNVVVMHHPPYSSGKHGSTSYMQWPFKSWGADVVLAGHDHLYERIIIDEFAYLVNGVGGEDIYGFGTAVPGSQVRFNQDYGAIRAEVNTAYMKFQFFTRAGILVDEYITSNTFPVVSSIVRTSSGQSNATSVEFAVTFSASVTGVDISDFSLTTANINGATINSVNGSGNTYVVSVLAGSGDGTLRLDFIDDDSITNIYGNKPGDTGTGNGNFLNGETYTIDRTPPSIISLMRASSAPSTAASVDFVATFSESVTGVDPTDFILTSSTFSGDTIESINGAANTYIVSVNTGTGDHILGINFQDDDSISDSAGNRPGGLGVGNGNLSGSETYQIDKTAPTVSSIIRASPDPTSAGSVDFIVTFSEPVSGVDVSDFALNSINLSNAAISTVSNVDPFYIVTVNTGTGAGILRLDLIDNDSILDVAGNTPGGVGSGNGNFVSGEFYNVDKGPPYVISITRAGPDPTNATNVDFIITFSESVIGVDITDFRISTSNIEGSSISSVNGSGNIYTVSVNSGSGDGTLRVDLFDDDSIMNNYSSNLGGPGTDNGNFINGETTTIDKTAPKVTSIIRGGPDPSGSTHVDFIVTFSESVTGVDVTDFIPIGSNISRSTINTVENFDPFYLVSVNTGIGTGTLRLDLLDNDSILDLAGNQTGGLGQANGNFVTGDNYNISKASMNFPPPAISGSKRNLVTIDTTPTFSWTIVRGAIAYEVLIATDKNFTQLVTSYITEGLFYTANPPLVDGIYFWHVRAYNQDLQPGRFGYTQSFTIDTSPPEAPILLTPIDHSSVSKKLSFQWAELSSATTYQIDVDNNYDFSSPEFSALKNSASAKSSVFPKGNYFWRVRAKDFAGNWGNWSVVFTFTIP